MSKLPEQYKFIDLSDYGRPPARWIATSLKETSVTPIQLTSCFIVSGLLAIYCILVGEYVTAAFFLILKSILDAADGELSRLKDTPSYIGRYYDSIADIILNFMFFLSFWYVSNDSIGLVFLAFIGVQLQGTLYNYYYVILRNSVDGDKTSRIFEDSAPTAMNGESQQAVNLFYKIYDFLYITFDKAIYNIDKQAIHSKPFPRWFMTLLSTYGLGFQLLIMAIMLALGLKLFIVSFFIATSSFILVFVGIRKFVL
jgi:hypothetical protein